MHPHIAGFYLASWRMLTEGNESVPGNKITVAMLRSIEFGTIPDRRTGKINIECALIWERDAVDDAILAAHCGRQLGFLERE